MHTVMMMIKYLSKAINAVPYYGMHVCFSSPFEYLPKESVLRDQFACMIVRAIKQGTANDLKERLKNIQILVQVTSNRYKHFSCKRPHSCM